MRGIVAAVVCMSLFAFAASAAEIEFYFSLQGDVSAVPTEYASETTLTVACEETVYLWAQVDSPDIWNVIDIDFASDCAGFATAGVAYNPEFPHHGSPYDLIRWETGSDFDPTDPDSNLRLVAVTTQGLGKVLDPMGVDGHFMLGEFSFTCDDCFAQPVYLEAGGNGIKLRNGTAREHVYFGFGDSWVYNDSPQGMRTDMPDLFLIPEPNGLLLFGVAGLVLRRR